MPDQRIDENKWNGEREHNAEVVGDDRAHDGNIRHDAGKYPAEMRHRIGQQRQHGCDEEERRGVLPGKIALKILTELRDLHPL